jgi:hypothetical protein
MLFRLRMGTVTRLHLICLSNSLALLCIMRAGRGIYLNSEKIGLRCGTDRAMRGVGLSTPAERGAGALQPSEFVGEFVQADGWALRRGGADEVLRSELRHDAINVRVLLTIFWVTSLPALARMPSISVGVLELPKNLDRKAKELIQASLRKALEIVRRKPKPPSIVYDPYGPSKPPFLPDGERLKCPACQKISVFQPHDLMYRKD